MKQINIIFKTNTDLISAIIQDYQSGEIYMLGYMNKEAFKKTFKTKNVWFWSRSRKRLWMKRETSANTLLAQELFLDCDNDTILVKVKLLGSNVCHTGSRTCFFTKL